MSNCNYFVNQIIVSKGKRVILLPDNYGPLSKNHLTIAETSPGFCFWTEQDLIQDIRKSYHDVKVYGFWEVLHQQKIIDLTKEEGLFIVYQDDKQSEGLFLYYNRSKTQFTTGLIINGNPVGSLNININNAQIIEPNINKLSLKNEILLPIERKRIQQKFYQKIVIQNAVVVVIIALIALALNVFIFNYDNEITAKKKEVHKIEKQLRTKKDIIATQRINSTPKNLITPHTLALFSPLSSLVLLPTKGVSFETPLNSKELSFTINNSEELPLWLYPLQQEGFTFSENEKTITIKWSKK